MTEEQTAADSRLPLCLSDIDGFDNVIARMPTAEECQGTGISADTPVLVMRRRGGEMIYPAGMVRLTIDTGPEPGPDAVRDAARYIVGEVLEDLDNVRGWIVDLYYAMKSPPREVVRLADEYRQRRTAGTGECDNSGPDTADVTNADILTAIGDLAAREIAVRSITDAAYEWGRAAQPPQSVPYELVKLLDEGYEAEFSRRENGYFASVDKFGDDGESEYSKPGIAATPGEALWKASPLHPADATYPGDDPLQQEIQALRWLVKGAAINAEAVKAIYDSAAELARPGAPADSAR